MSVILEAADGSHATISKEAAELALTVKDLLECCNDSDSPIPLLNIAHGRTLNLLVDFLEEYYQKVIKPSDEEQLKALTEKYHKKLYEDSENDWVKKYTEIKLPNGKQDWATHFDLAEVGNYVHAQCLMEVMARKVAETVQGKTPGELQEEFRISKKTTDTTEETATTTSTTQPEDTEVEPEETANA